jgi:hypothetical protein
MNKKYEILNLNPNVDCTIFYVLYIVLFFVIIFVIYKIIYNFSNHEKFSNLLKMTNNFNNKFENFDTVSSSSQNQTKTNNIVPNQIMTELIEKNKELTNIKNVIQEKLEKQSQAIYLSQNYDKVDSSSFNDEMMFLMDKFSNTNFPSVDLTNKTVIKTQPELDSILSEAKLMKNFYNPGDIVNSNSTFSIDKNNICYRSNGQLVKPTVEFLQKYPECMVCSVESEQNLYNTNSWKTTKTNINKVCLYNPDAETNSGIPNLSDCQNFCGIPKNIPTNTNN